jgi:hypothetical protein
MHNHRRPRPPRPPAAQVPQAQRVVAAGGGHQVGAGGVHRHVVHRGAVPLQAALQHPRPRAHHRHPPRLARQQQQGGGGGGVQGPGTGVVLLASLHWRGGWQRRQQTGIATATQASDQPPRACGRCCSKRSRRPSSRPLTSASQYTCSTSISPPGRQLYTVACNQAGHRAAYHATVQSRPPLGTWHALSRPAAHPVPAYCRQQVAQLWAEVVEGAAIDGLAMPFSQPVARIIRAIRQQISHLAALAAAVAAAAGKGAPCRLFVTPAPSLLP